MKSPELFIKRCAIALACLVLTLIYLHSFHNGFFYDDVYLILQNPAVHSLKNIPKFFTDISTHGSRVDYQVYYRPMSLLSFAMDYWLGKGANTVVYHIHTFIGFVLLCFFVFLFSKKVFGHLTTQSFYLSLFATCCFAFNPAIADVINYNAGRDISFSALYGMMYIILYLYSPFARKYYLYFIPLVIGCLFKITAITFMPVLWLYIMFFEADKGLNDIVGAVKSTWRKILPDLLFTAFIAAVVWLKSKPANVGIEGLSHTTYLLTQTHVILNYFILYFSPENLNPNAWHEFVTSPTDLRFLVGSVFIVGLLAAIYVLSLTKNMRPVSYGLAFFLITLLPESTFLPLMIPQNDYRMFPSAIGLSISMAAVAYLIVKNFGVITKLIKPLVVTCCFVFLAFIAYASRDRVRVWSSDKAMWEDVLKKDPTNGRVLMNLGVYVMQQGKLDEAEQYFERAKAFSPYYDLIYVNLGIIKNQKGDTAVSLKGFDYAESCFYYAQFLHNHIHDAEVVPLLQASLAANPGLLQSRYLLMDMYAYHLDKQLAALCNQTLSLFPSDATTINYYKLYTSDSVNFVMGGISDSLVVKPHTQTPTNPNYISLSIEYFNKGDYKKSIEACEKAIEIDPKSAIAYNNMCAAYNNLKEWDNAIEAGKKALELNPNFDLAKNNLNFALTQKEKR